MADEKADQSIKKPNSTPVASSSQQPVRLPDEPNKPKRRRRRRSRRRGGNSKVPDSVIAEQDKLRSEAAKQENARLGDLAKELKDDQTEVKGAAPEDKSAARDDKKTDKSESTVTLPELKVNGKPYRPQERQKRERRHPGPADPDEVQTLPLQFLRPIPEPPNKIIQVSASPFPSVV